MIPTFGLWKLVDVTTCVSISSEFFSLSHEDSVDVLNLPSLDVSIWKLRRPSYVTHDDDGDRRERILDVPLRRRAEYAEGNEDRRGRLHVGRRRQKMPQGLLV